MDAINKQNIDQMAQQAFAAVFRYDFSQAGFYVVELDNNITSSQFRQWMIELKQQLEQLFHQAKNKYLGYLSLDRTSRAFTTKFHLEATPDNESLLMLGYETTQVTSCLHLFDYCKYIYDNQIVPDTFFTTFQKQQQQNPDMYQPYIETIALDGQKLQIVIINNSFYPAKLDGTSMLGVMHKGQVFAADGTEERIINAVALRVTDIKPSQQQQEREFILSEDVTYIS